MLTLNEVLKKPLSTKRNFSAAIVKDVAKVLSSDMAGDLSGKASPDDEAILFYMRNHAMAIVRSRAGGFGRLSPGFERIASDYYVHASVQVRRLYYYCLLIITRESRHVYKNGAWSSLKPLVHPAVYNFVDSLNGCGSDGAADKFKKIDLTVTLGEYVQGLSTVFHKGNFSGGYGGHKWGDIADCLLNYVVGTYSPEMFIDTAFTLCHNNGPIFNKGMLYKGYSSQFTKILDIQRAGMIPQWLWGLGNGGQGISYDPPLSILELHKEYQAILGADFAGHVDWVQVAKHGVNSFSSQIAAQNALTSAGVYPDQGAKNPAAAPKPSQAGYSLLGKKYPIMVRSYDGSFVSKVEVD